MATTAALSRATTPLSSSLFQGQKLRSSSSSVLGAAVPLPALNRKNVAKVPRARCQVGAEGNSQVAGSRRHLLLGASAAAAAAAVLPQIVVPESAQAANLTERIQRGEYLVKLRTKLKQFVKSDPKVINDILALALHDAGTYDKASDTGGANGSIVLDEELNRPENQKLKPIVAKLKKVKEEFDADAGEQGPVGWADLIYVAGEAALQTQFLFSAIETAGGDEKKGAQLAVAFGSAGQWGFFDKKLGRKDATEPSPAGRIPGPDAPLSAWADTFQRAGLTPKYVVALSLGLGPDQAATEAELAKDSRLARAVKDYQKSRQTVSQTDYQVDAIVNFTKLSILGQEKLINYEKYAKKTRPINLRF
ncbi:ascorbate peroxidase [Klebsormidium nitens]|uniref:Ascorbate peroxidase n=1 Tax=Klebsormidium nitens TaxID=105231 RepID=A0A1Y1HUP6_KLENI|nr:ascorbate peroxidase [Klebsormidium nitens]|eukprot:GAQ82344.1 ascorbate peroxidase [Klebsormidium nitens]